MKLIDRYILILFLKMFIASIAVFIVLFEVITFFDLIDDFIALKAPAKLVFFFFILKLPEAVFHLSPMAVLIGAILTFTLVSRSREVIIMMGSGLSVWRIAAPVLVASLLLSVLSFLNGDYLLPYALQKSRLIFDYKIRKQEVRSLARKNDVWIKSKDEKIWNITYFNVKTGIINGVTVLSFSPGKNRFTSIIHANIAYQRNGAWIFRNGYERKFDKEGGFSEKRFNALKIRSTLEIAALKEAKKIPQEMDLTELREYARKIKSSGFDDTRYRVEIYRKISFPLVCLVMAFIAVPFSIKAGDEAGILFGVITGVFLGFLFWFLDSMGTSLGLSGRLPPLISVTWAHIVFTLFAFYKTSKIYGSLPYAVSRKLRGARS